LEEGEKVCEWRGAGGGGQADVKREGGARDWVRGKDELV
jgi:hypothetical protein